MTKTHSLTAEEVVQFLQAQPRFIEQHPQLMDVLSLPQRNLGDTVADFQAYQLRHLRGKVGTLRAHQQNFLAAGQANSDTLGRIHGAVLRLCEAKNFTEFAHLFHEEIPAILDVEVAVLAIESDHKKQAKAALHLPLGTLERWLGPADTLLRANTTGYPELFGADHTSIRSLAVVRLELEEGQPQGIVAFGSPDPEWFTPDQATDLITFFAGVVARRVRQLLP